MLKVTVLSCAVLCFAACVLMASLSKLLCVLYSSLKLCHAASDLLAGILCCSSSLQFWQSAVHAVNKSATSYTCGDVLTAVALMHNPPQQKWLQTRTMLKTVPCLLELLPLEVLELNLKHIIRACSNRSSRRVLTHGTIHMVCGLQAAAGPGSTQPCQQQAGRGSAGGAPG